MIAGYYIRVLYMPDPGRFKIFVGCVLAYLGIRLMTGVLKSRSDKARSGKTAETGTAGRYLSGRVGLSRSVMTFEDGQYQFSTIPVFFASIIVGIVGGAYGIGGGALLAPFCISVLNLPPFVVAGATLASTWLFSAIAAAFYALMSAGQGADVSPDWLLGGLFGLGGLAGIYCGARFQHRFPADIIKLILCVTVLTIAAIYLFQAF